MGRGQRMGGWPLAVASLSLAAGVLFGVRTVQVQEVVPRPAPSTIAPGHTVTSDQFVAQMASRIARQLRHRGIHLTSDDVVELLTDDGDPGVVVGSAPTVPQPHRRPRPQRTTTTTTATTTTTEPPLLDLNDRIDLGHLPDRAQADPPPATTTVP